MTKAVIITVLATAGILGGIFWFSAQEQKARTAEISGVEEFSLTDRTHTTEDVEYEEGHPVGGEHAPNWLACNNAVYDEPVNEEQAVHSLEHGAVWITYNEDATDEEVEELESKLGTYSFLSPVPEQESLVLLTAWNNRLSLDSVEDERVDQFLAKFRQGPQTPEPGATCDA